MENNNNLSSDNNQDTKKKQKIIIGTNAVYKPEILPSECNPDNGAFFEGRSNPLSSKGN